MLDSPPVSNRGHRFEIYSIRHPPPPLPPHHLLHCRTAVITHTRHFALAECKPYITLSQPVDTVCMRGCAHCVYIIKYLQ